MRITKANLSALFVALVETANNAGVDTSRWVFHHGSAAYSHAHEIWQMSEEGSGHSVIARLSTSRSEAYRELQAMRNAFDLAKRKQD